MCKGYVNSVSLYDPGEKEHQKNIYGFPFIHGYFWSNGVAEKQRLVA